MKKIIKIGRPVHYRLRDGSTACGLVGVQHAAYDPRDCDCLRCQQTFALREALPSADFSARINRIAKKLGM